MLLFILVFINTAPFPISYSIFNQSALYTYAAFSVIASGMTVNEKYVYPFWVVEEGDKAPQYDTMIMRGCVVKIGRKRDMISISNYEITAATYVENLKHT